jgi:hypothetical protein
MAGKIFISYRRDDDASAAARVSDGLASRFGKAKVFIDVDNLLAGLVSRVSPVHTALRNCTRDEGRSFEVGNQVLISNHRKLLCPKGTVVNVAEKSEQDSDRCD